MARRVRHFQIDNSEYADDLDTVYGYYILFLLLSFQFGVRSWLPQPRARRVQGVVVNRAAHRPTLKKPLRSLVLEKSGKRRETKQRNTSRIAVAHFAHILFDFLIFLEFLSSPGAHL